MPRGEDLELQLVVLDRLLKATTMKKVVNFLRKKVHPLEYTGYAYVFEIAMFCHKMMMMVMVMIYIVLSCLQPSS